MKIKSNLPKLKFRVIDNPDGMIHLIKGFLLYPQRGFEWGKIYYKEYPQFGKLIKCKKNKKEIEKISQDFFKKLYFDKLNYLESIAKKFQKEWDSDGEKLLHALSEVVEKKWPKNWKEFSGWISLNPILPRFLDLRAFDVYWKSSPKEMKETCLHEILHFIWFEKWKDVFSDYDAKEFESPHLVWKLSEIVPFAVLGDERIQKIFPHEPHVYDKWKSIKIEGLPLLEYFQNFYYQRESFEDFMKQSWRFVQKHKNKLK